MDKMTRMKAALSRIAATVKEVDAQVEELKPGKFGAANVDMQKAIKAMGYQKVKEALEAMRRELPKEH